MITLATVESARGCSSVVELQPSKLVTRVRFPSPAPQILVSGSDETESDASVCAARIPLERRR
jgi:hypothetical protein